MVNPNKWNSWLFNTATTWSEGQLDLPVVDLQYINKINNCMMQELFILNSALNKFITAITPSGAKQINGNLQKASDEIEILLDQKKELIHKINKDKISLYNHINTQITKKLNEIKILFENGLFNRCLNTSSELLTFILETIEHTDKNNFSIDEFIKLINFTDQESLKLYISYSDFPSIKKNQQKLIDHITIFHTHYTRRDDDYFTLEEMFTNINTAIVTMKKEEINIIEKFDIKIPTYFQKELENLDKQIQVIKEKLTYRTKISDKEILHFYKAIIYHINHTVYSTATTKKISLDYFSGLKSYEQISELLFFDDTMNEWAKKLFELLAMSFDSNIEKALFELQNFKTLFDKFEGMINAQSINKEILQSDDNTILNDSLYKVHFDSFNENINDLINFIKENNTNKGKDYKNYLLKNFTILLMEISNDRS